MISNIGDTPKQLEQGLMFDGEVWTKERIKSLQAQLEKLRKLHCDLTNADMVFEEDCHTGYLITHDQLEEMEFIFRESAQCLAERDAEIAKGGFIEGYSSCWFEHYGTRPEQQSFDFSAEQYASKLRQTSVDKQ